MPDVWPSTLLSQLDVSGSACSTNSPRQSRSALPCGSVDLFTTAPMPFLGCPVEDYILAIAGELFQRVCSARSSSPRS